MIHQKTKSKKKMSEKGPSIKFNLNNQLQEMFNVSNLFKWILVGVRACAFVLTFYFFLSL